MVVDRSVGRSVYRTRKSNCEEVEAGDRSVLWPFLYEILRQASGVQFVSYRTLIFDLSRVSFVLTRLRAVRCSYLVGLCFRCASRLAPKDFFETLVFLFERFREIMHYRLYVSRYNFPSVFRSERIEGTAMVVFSGSTQFYVDYAFDDISLWRSVRGWLRRARTRTSAQISIVRCRSWVRRNYSGWRMNPVRRVICDSCVASFRSLPKSSSLSFFSRAIFFGSSCLAVALVFLRAIVLTPFDRAYLVRLSVLFLFSFVSYCFMMLRLLREIRFDKIVTNGVHWSYVSRSSSVDLSRVESNRVCLCSLPYLAWREHACDYSAFDPTVRSTFLRYNDSTSVFDTFERSTERRSTE